MVNALQPITLMHAFNLHAMLKSVGISFKISDVFDTMDDIFGIVHEICNEYNRI